MHVVSVQFRKRDVDPQAFTIMGLADLSVDFVCIWPLRDNGTFQVFRNQIKSIKCYKKKTFSCV